MPRPFPVVSVLPPLQRAALGVAASSRRNTGAARSISSIVPIETRVHVVHGGNGRPTMIPSARHASWNAFASAVSDTIFLDARRGGPVPQLRAHCGGTAALPTGAADDGAEARSGAPADVRRRPQNCRPAPGCRRRRDPVPVADEPGLAFSAPGPGEVDDRRDPWGVAPGEHGSEQVQCAPFGRLNR